MISIFIQSIQLSKNIKVPIKITIGYSNDPNNIHTLSLRPEVSIPKRIYAEHHLDRIEILSAPPFCDIADELIEICAEQQLMFSEKEQFYLLKHQFKKIGFNFDVKPHLIEASKGNEGFIAELLQNLRKRNVGVLGLDYARAMHAIIWDYSQRLTIAQKEHRPRHGQNFQLEYSTYATRPGVYFFLNEYDEVVYVGKAKNIRKRLQSHASGSSKQHHIDYAAVKDISVEYTGNDILAQLIESENIKNLRPVYNTQQIENPKPYIINIGKTAKGICKLSISRKEVDDNFPELYFNRTSVKESLKNFCNSYKLCKKHCGVERVKGPCSNDTNLHLDCVCMGTVSIENYNNRFQIALDEFKNRKSRIIYKLKGRNREEDAFVYMINGIYEGYGFIDKEEYISNENDILGHLVPQKNNYDTSRITNGIEKSISNENIIQLVNS